MGGEVVDVAPAAGGWSASQWKAILLMYPTYMSALFSRAAMDASLPAMLADTLLNCTVADSAALLSSGVAFYSVGKLLGGTFTDLLGAKKTFCATTLNSGLMMVLVSASGSMRMMQLWWGISRLGGACYWPAMMKVTSSHFDDSSFGEAWSILTTSSRLGAIAGGLVASVVLRLSSWQSIMRISGINLLVMGTVISLFLRQGPVVKTLPPAKDGAREVSFVAALRKLLLDKRIFLTFASQGFTLPLLELNSLLPLFLVQTAAMPVSAASTMATAYPIGAMASMLLSGRAFVKLGDAGRAKLFGAQSALSLLALQVLSMSPSSPAVIISCLAAVMLGIAPTIFLAPSALITRYTTSRVQGTMGGLVEVPGYVSSMIFLRFYPQLLTRGGWQLVMRVMQVCVLGGALCNTAVWSMEARRPTTQPLA
jgi:sugar phosphate permease